MVPKLDVKIDPVTNQRRARDRIRDLLLMKSRNNTIDERGIGACEIRHTVMKKIWSELQNGK